MNKGAAILEVTYELIVQALGLPEGTRIVAITQEPKNVLCRSVQLLVEGDNLPCVPEGGEPPRMAMDGLPNTIFEASKTGKEVEQQVRDVLENLLKGM